jgi:hypothetical protein
MATYEWKKARKALDEVLKKEGESYKNLITEIEETTENNLILKEKEKINKKFRRKQKKLLVLEKKYKKEKGKYDTKIEKQRFEIRFKNIRNETNHLARS